MFHNHVSALLMGSAALALCGCGGGGGGGVASTPAPPASPTPTPSPTPSPTPTPAPAPAGQEITSKGVMILVQEDGPDLVSTNDATQLKIRYDAATGGYQVKLSGTTWDPLRPCCQTPGVYQANGENIFLTFEQSSATGYSYSNLARWRRIDDVRGATAFGSATPAAGVPVTGNATYDGQIAGYSTERVVDHLAGQPVGVRIDGSISLSFNFAGGTLAGGVSPILDLYGPRHSLIPLTFTNTVYAAGRTSFSGSFATSLDGPNSFSGFFAGPTAQEVMGNFAFPYVSPIDGHTYSAGGAFVGKKP